MQTVIDEATAAASHPVSLVLKYPANSSRWCCRLPDPPAGFARLARTAGLAGLAAAAGARGSCSAAAACTAASCTARRQQLRDLVGHGVAAFYRLAVRIAKGLDEGTLCVLWQAEGHFVRFSAAAYPFANCTCFFMS
jgi:hypothetical protein